MKFVIDIGNTTVSTALFDNNKILKRFLYDSNNFNKQIFLSDFNLMQSKFDITYIVYSSVVPTIEKEVLQIFKDINYKHVIDIKESNINLDMKVNDKNEVGADLIADLYAAKVENLFPCLIIDLGTANKFLLLDKDGAFSSCLISPGIISSFDALFGDAALLNKVAIDDIPFILEAKATKQALVGGLIYSTISSIEGIAKRYEKALGYKIKKIVTGGNAFHIKSLLKKDFIYDDSLLLRGLNYINKSEE